VKPFIRSTLVALGILGASIAAQAQDYPTRVITILVPFPAGGSTDVLGRVLAESMGRALKQPIIVENVGGAGGTIGVARAAKSKNDGYTLLFHNMAHASAPALYRSLSYDPVADFEPIGLVTDVPMILVARKDFPPKDMKELLTYVKANKDKVTFANAGIGATSHMCAMLFTSAIQTEVTSVPFKGTGPALNDLMGSQVDLLCDQPASTTGLISGGRIKAYAVANPTRLKTMPTVPTFAESGLPNFQLAVWHGLYAPKGTPKAALDKLSGALQQALKDPALVTKFAELGTEPVAAERAKPEPLRAHVKAELAQWGPIIKKAGVYAD
jgi:tripartite-type tricarboxylate transporter receptor subunit TctC